VLFHCCFFLKGSAVDILKNFPSKVKFDRMSVGLLIVDGLCSSLGVNSTNPLIISNVSASCGCTVPEKPEAPIKTGEIGVIKVKFDSNGRAGSAYKTVTVLSNAQPGFPELALKGEVTPKAK
jgi:hypothetical protein